MPSRMQNAFLESLLHQILALLGTHLLSIHLRWDALCIQVAVLPCAILGTSVERSAFCGAVQKEVFRGNGLS